MYQFTCIEGTWTSENEENTSAHTHAHIMCATHMRFVDTKLICDMIRPHSSLAPGPVDPIASRAQNPAALPPARSRHVTNVYEQMYARHEIHEYVCRYTY